MDVVSLFGERKVGRDGYTGVGGLGMLGRKEGAGVRSDGSVGVGCWCFERGDMCALAGEKGE
ncbi:hypothetical protein O9A_00072 [Bartonella koehlerae C-29]|uniref:Uncharacterized protein n=1 Tax=Bartonella koehlerae C-29 TaxID=1134510 RepID=A0A067WII1_9HYPH|nr:hypothetical protein O9A_00072 [Bartonella koehlerae C-29]